MFVMADFGLFLRCEVKEENFPVQKPPTAVFSVRKANINCFMFCYIVGNSYFCALLEYYEATKNKQKHHEPAECRA